MRLPRPIKNSLLPLLLFFAAQKNSRSRSQQKITGVTIRMHARLLNMPPMTGVASGFITSAPVR
jgi:hypothetical protein